MRKALQAEAGKSDMEAKVCPACPILPVLPAWPEETILVEEPNVPMSVLQILQLTQDKRDLEAEVQKLKAKCGMFCAAALSVLRVSRCACRC